MRENISFYKNLIKKHGYKFTIQKRIILLEVINSNTHLSVKEIYDRVKHNRIGITTVYRSLKTFNELGIVKEINVNGTSYYEIKIFSGNPLHIHFKCSKCNSIIDIEDKFLNLEYIKLNKKIEEKNNLEIDDLNIMLIGTCSKCKEDMNG
ncbi:transcriptional repressor [Clostridium botulinum]|nr:transcriptional repressor [Clostridium botulinum]